MFYLSVLLLYNRHDRLGINYLRCAMFPDCTGPCLRNCLFGIANPGVHRVGRSIAFFFFYKKMEVTALNLFEMQAKLYAELTDDIFRYYSVPKNSQLKHKILCWSRYLKQ